MRISDWSSDVCSSDLDDVGDVQIAIGDRWRADAHRLVGQPHMHCVGVGGRMDGHRLDSHLMRGAVDAQCDLAAIGDQYLVEHATARLFDDDERLIELDWLRIFDQKLRHPAGPGRSEEHTSELQSLMRDW